MINLLKNNNNLKSLGKLKESNQKDDDFEDLTKVNIRRYKDPYGLTLGKMQFGLWLISNRRNFLSIFLAFLILLSFVFWSLFIYTFGFYIFKGMKDDQSLIESFSDIFISENTLRNMSAQDLEFSGVKVFSLGKNKYDFLIKVKNLNKNYFAHFDYYFENDNQFTPLESSFVLPKESKYIMSLGLNLPERWNRKKTKIILKNLRWERINNKKIPDWSNFKKNRLKISTMEENFLAGQSNNLSDKINLNKLEFVTQNDTAYNYWEVNFKIILLDRGEEVAANVYKINNFMSGKKVKGNIIWPGSVPRFNEILIMPEIDISRDDIYIPVEGDTGQLK